MERIVLERVLLDQRVEALEWARKRIVSRDEERLVDLSSERAQVVMGVRRSGKSTLCQAVLRKSNRPFAYINFDDDRLAAFRGEDLDVALELLYKHYGLFEVLFLDEAQNVPEWFLFVNRLLRQGIHILVTGSNAKLLSGELATHLTGRHHRVELLPFSFPEFCRLRGVDPEDGSTRGVGLRQGVIDVYLRQGGFPELARGGTLPEAYLAELVDNVLERDIRQRHRFQNFRLFRDLANHLLDVAPTVLNGQTVSKRLGGKMTGKTVRLYVDYLKQAYLLIGVSRWSTKSHLRIRGEKLYPVDVGFMQGHANALVGENLGWRLETVVLLDLLRRHRPFMRTVCYFQTKRSEADFVVCARGQVCEVVQVAYAFSSPRVREREIRGALAAAEATHCQALTIVTYAEYEDIEVDGLTIRVRPAYDWLCRHD